MSTPNQTRSAVPTRAREFTKDNEVYGIVRGRILSGRYQPAERLREEELSREFGVTRTPLRLAFRRLEHEGLLVGEPFCGVHVRALRADEIAPLFDMREVLEGLAARNVALDQSETVLAVLRRLAEACDAQAIREEWPQFFAADKAFHWELIQQSRNPRLIEVMEVYNFQLRTFALHDRYLPLIVDTLRGDMARLRHIHTTLVDIMSSGDAHASETALRQHVLDSKRLIVESVAETEFEQPQAT